MKHELTTEIEINSSPQEVWSVLVDLDSWEEWNPFITSCTGVPEAGTRLVNRMEAPGTRAMTFKPTVTEVSPQRAFEWVGKMGISGLFDGRHRFELHETASGTRLVQSEKLSGILVRPMRRTLAENTMAGFREMNEALKGRVEMDLGTDARPTDGSLNTNPEVDSRSAGG